MYFKYSPGTWNVAILKSRPSEADGVCVVSAGHYQSSEESFAETFFATDGVDRDEEFLAFPLSFL